uniref:Pentatricopeptide repeat-containing protein n=1 Tax=Tanacetum cinerariifolium TaxID=118510 RepID=A0A6L2LSS8_TANCI|nr:pentatricopeptide repeat-containing protein [Tanacetum cinerariifolium]
MLYCVANSEKFNLAYYMAKRMEWVTKQARLILPYGMLLTRMFKFVMSESSELLNEFYVLYDRVMNPLTAHQERKTRKDHSTRRDRHFTSSSFAFDQPSFSHPNDDDDGNGEGTSRTFKPQPLQSHPSLDITLSLSPITPFDHILDTSSQPSPQPQPQPPLMVHPIYFNYHDYHGSIFLCCFHNRNRIFSLRDKMNLMFAHLKYFLTTTMNSLSPPHP